MAIPGLCIKHSKRVDFTRLSGWPITNCWSTFYKTAEELTYRRNRLLLLTNPKDSTDTNVDEILRALDDYYRQPIETLISAASNPQSVTFHWTNLLGPKNCISHSVTFERASMLLRVVLWLRNHGHQVTNPSFLVKAVSLLLAILEMNVEPVSPDLNRDNIKALIYQLSAEILVMKILINYKGLSTSPLNQSCHDAVTAAVNVTSAGQLIDETIERAKKWKLYLLFKYELYTSLSHILQSQMVLENGRAGDAISCIHLAKTRYDIAETVSKKYEKTSPRCKVKASGEDESQRILEELNKQVAESEAENVQCNQEIPKVAPKLDIPPIQPEINPHVTAYRLPQIDILRLEITEEESNSTEEGSSCSEDSIEDSDCSIMGSCGDCCHYTCRLLVFIICVPFLLLLGLLGIILSIVILPFRLCCPCCGPCLKALLDGLMWLLKSPFEFLMWATKSRHDDDGETIELTKTAGDT